MEKNDLDPENIPKKTCKYCGYPIPAIAVKCKECGNYLNWRKYIALGNAIFLTLISLATVVGSNAEKIYELFIKPNSKLNATFQSIDKDAVIVAASNSGSRPGTVGSVYFYMTHRYPPEEETSFPLAHDGKRDDLTIDPYKTKTIRFGFMDPVRANAALDTIDVSKFKCAIAIQTIQFSGRKNFPLVAEPRHRRSVDCYDVVYVLHPKYSYRRG